MFRVGQPIVVRVEALGLTRTDVRLTMDPGRLQGHWPRSMLKKGAALVAAVRSVEDHVYVMDVGLGGVRAFLKKPAAHKYLQTWTAVQSFGELQLLYNYDAIKHNVCIF
ncbi:hypothetical protein PR048_000023 [Dryococelus australis]|uniref:Uncharacterized protein n=1 Tax=Dryococelus australis TaxID=614101 RepID=A0ABQ9IDH1_9NEOP|nr:hypothetical protein PR048_000023 [Dryococelus australis]